MDAKWSRGACFNYPESDNDGMCSNYVAVTRADRLLSFFGVKRERNDPPVETWPTGLAPTSSA